MTVAADSATLNGALHTTQDTKPAAVEAAAGALRELITELSSLGGVPLTVESRNQPLTWSAYSATTESEHENDEHGRYHLTGRVIASVAVQILVREFGLLDRLSAILARQEALTVHHVAWAVDPDNRSWPRVRADAIQAAIDKGRDYATALGGSLSRVEHIADVGLLGGEAVPLGGVAGRSYRENSFNPGGLPDTPSLDPVPQELIAVIDARFLAEVAAL
jgi:uncharacterized protein YggE